VAKMDEQLTGEDEGDANEVGVGVGATSALASSNGCSADNRGKLEPEPMLTARRARKTKATKPPPAPPARCALCGLLDGEKGAPTSGSAASIGDGGPGPGPGRGCTVGAAGRSTGPLLRKPVVLSRLPKGQGGGVRRSAWVHASCARHSAEVVEVSVDVPAGVASDPDHDPDPDLGSSSARKRQHEAWQQEQQEQHAPRAFHRWCNVAAAVKRGRQLACSGCGKRGATVGCFTARCKANYHFPVRCLFCKQAWPAVGGHALAYRLAASVHI
jgi:hypothetical protein